MNAVQTAITITVNTITTITAEEGQSCLFRQLRLCSNRTIYCEGGYNGAARVYAYSAATRLPVKAGSHYPNLDTPRLITPGRNACAIQ